MSKFIDTLSPCAADEDLCLREFCKSLCDQAYTWYIGLKLGSILMWDDMADVFCTKYFHGEETVTFATLQGTKQKNGEDLMSTSTGSRILPLIAMITMKRRRWWKFAWET